MNQNVSLGSNGVDRVCSLRKIPMRLCGTNFLHSFGSLCTEFHKATKGSRKHPNSTKMHQNVSLGSNGVDRVRSLRKILTRFRSTKFCTSSARFASSFVRQPNSPECTRIVRNAPKWQFRVQWGGSGAFDAKNSDATSWHELLH